MQPPKACPGDPCLGDPCHKSASKRQAHLSKRSPRPALAAQSQRANKGRGSEEATSIGKSVAGTPWGGTLENLQRGDLPYMQAFGGQEGSAKEGGAQPSRWQVLPLNPHGFQGLSH